MEKSIVDILEKTTKKYPKKLAFVDSNRQVSYEEFLDNSKKLGTFINNKYKQTNKSIIIFIDKTVNCLEAMIGSIYSGNFYTIIDVKTPKERANSIVENLDSKVIITDNKNLGKLQKLELNIENVFIYEDMIKTEIDQVRVGYYKFKKNRYRYNVYTLYIRVNWNSKRCSIKS